MAVGDGSEAFASGALWPLLGPRTTPMRARASYRVTNYDRSITLHDTSPGCPSHPVLHLIKGFVVSGLA